MKKFAEFWRKMLMSVEIMVCVMRFIYFFELLYVRYNCGKFHHCRICVTDSREGVLFGPQPMSSLKRAILNRVKRTREID